MPEIGAEGAVLENFGNFLEKLFLKSAIKSKVWVHGGKEFFRKVVAESDPKSGFADNLFQFEP